MQESYANVAFRIPADLLGVSITDVKGAWAGNDQEPEGGTAGVRRTWNTGSSGVTPRGRTQPSKTEPSRWGENTSKRSSWVREEGFGDACNCLTSVFGEKKIFPISVVKTPLLECQVINLKPFESFVSFSYLLLESWLPPHSSSCLLPVLWAATEMLLPGLVSRLWHGALTPGMCSCLPQIRPNLDRKLIFA